MERYEGGGCRSGLLVIRERRAPASPLHIGSDGDPLDYYYYYFKRAEGALSLFFCGFPAGATDSFIFPLAVGRRFHEMFLGSVVCFQM